MIKQAAALIRNSKAPMIFVGSGAIEAREEILELAEMIDAPVVAFRSVFGSACPRAQYLVSR